VSLPDQIWWALGNQRLPKRKARLIRQLPGASLEEVMQEFCQPGGLSPGTPGAHAVFCQCELPLLGLRRRQESRSKDFSDGKGFDMKLVIAIISPDRLEAVKAALAEAEVFRLTVMDVQGFGRDLAGSSGGRVGEISSGLFRKVQLMIGVNDNFLEPTVNAILRAAKGGPSSQGGDGKIFILPLEDCIRIRTGERGPSAI
jgi:nitrogen regulatory protein P-II 2